jgi:hypothetical protein
LKAKHLLLGHPPLTENYIAAATVPHAGSAMTCHLSAHKSRPFAKAMEHLAEAAEVAIEAAVMADVEDAAAEEDDIKKKRENWRSSAGGK